MKYLLLFCWFLSSMILSAAEIKYDSPQTFYAGGETSINIITDGLNGKKLSWNLIYLSRTVAAGEIVGDDTGKAQIKFKFPDLNPGIIAETELTCSIGDNKFQKKLFFFYPNPFANEKNFVKDQKTGVFQPDGNGTVAALLESYELEFTKLSSVSDFDGKLLIASGISFNDNPGLFDELLKLSQNGVKVIILPPFSGTISLKSETINKLTLSGTDIISEFNKNYDANSWNDSEIASMSFKVVPYDENTGLEITGTKGSFSFCEIRNSLSKGKLIICGFNIISLAKQSPTPAYLLKDLISKY